MFYLYLEISREGQKIHSSIVPITIETYEKTE